MSNRYLILWDVPDGYDPSSILRRLPSPIASGPHETYNYGVRSDGFQIVDNDVDPAAVGIALRLLLDEALSYTDEASVRSSPRSDS